MELNEFAQLVDDMSVQHAYPGFDVRTLKLGLPAHVLKAPAKLFGAALKHENPMVRLAALRYFWDKPGVVQPFLRLLTNCLTDSDEIVRSEAIRCFERLSKVDPENAVRIADLLSDSYIDVRKNAAKALGKIGIKDQTVIAKLQEAAKSDSDHEVRWKAQKALRQLGAYVA